jgi:hypothetical protein
MVSQWNCRSFMVVSATLAHPTCSMPVRDHSSITSISADSVSLHGGIGGFEGQKMQHASELAVIEVWYPSGHVGRLWSCQRLWCIEFAACQWGISLQNP